MECKYPNIAEKIPLYHELGPEEKAQVQEHVTICQGCNSEFQVITAVVEKIQEKGRLRRSQAVHPPQEEVIQYVIDKGVLSLKQRYLIERHLEDEKCAECKQLRSMISETEEEIKQNTDRVRGGKNEKEKAVWTGSFLKVVVTGGVIVLTIAGGIGIMKTRQLTKQIHQRDAEIATLFRQTQNNRETILAYDRKLAQYEQQLQETKGAWMPHTEPVIRRTIGLQKMGEVNKVDIAFTSSNQIIPLVFSLPESEYTSYTAFISQKDQIVWDSKLQSLSAMQNKSNFALLLPERFFNPGEYTLQINLQGRRNTAVNYVLTISNRKD